MSAWDYVLDFVNPKTEIGITIRPNEANILIDKIDYSNFNLVIYKLQRLS